MAVRPVVRLPDPILTTPTTPVERFGVATESLASDLVETMRASPACVGLAANQIGVGLRAFVIDVSGHRKAVSCAGQVVMFNPVVVEDAAPVVGREGCMSVPDLTGDVARGSTVVVAGQDSGGREFTVAADAFEARALLHEIDHLDGRLFLDRVASHEAVFRRLVYR